MPQIDMRFEDESPVFSYVRPTGEEVDLSPELYAVVFRLVQLDHGELGRVIEIASEITGLSGVQGSGTVTRPPDTEH